MQVVWYGAAALALLPAVVAGSQFVRWRSRTRRRLLSCGTAVQTPSGPIDCAFAGPDGADPVLVLHGGLGGWDQAIGLAEDLGLARDFRVIAPSRPGYLRTPIEAGRSAAEAADAMAALLDALQVPKAFVVGLSGGGPTALALASRHPSRVAALVMVCAISHRHVQPAITSESLFGRVLLSNAGAWLLDFFCWLAIQAMRIAPVFMTRRIMAMTELGDRPSLRARALALRGSPRLRWTLRLLGYSFPISPRRAGLSNDLAAFASLADRVVGPIAAPVLVVHGGNDGNVPVAHAWAVLAAAPHAESLIIDDAGHLLWLHPRAAEIGGRVGAFLRSIRSAELTPAASPSR